MKQTNKQINSVSYVTIFEHVNAIVGEENMQGTKNRTLEYSVFTVKRIPC